MSGPAPATPQEDWIGVAVMVVADESLTRVVQEAVLRTGDLVATDPVLSDMAAVTMSRTTLPPAGNAPGRADELAESLHGELLSWGVQGRAVRAPRVTFALVVVGTDEQAVDASVEALQPTQALARLPVMLDRVVVHPEQDRQAATDELVRAIRRSVDDCAAEVERLRGFSLPLPREGLGDAGDLAAVTTPAAATALPGWASAFAAAREAPVEGVGYRTVELLPPPPEPAAEPALGPAGSVFRDVAAVAAPPAPPPVRPPAPPPAPGSSELALYRQTADPRPAETYATPEEDAPRRWEQLAALIQLPRVTRQPPTTAEMLDDVSRSARRVRLVYLVLVADPSRPRRAARAHRRAVAVALLDAFFDAAARDRDDVWYVRTFSAETSLQAGEHLTPEVRQRLQKHLPERWGDFYLGECSTELVEAVERDTSSLARRGVPRGAADVIMITGELPMLDPDTEARYAVLREIAAIQWVFLSSERQQVPPGFEAPGSTVVVDHADVVDEVTRRVLATGHGAEGGEPGGVTGSPGYVAGE
jgi:hypothetical protein